MNDFLYHVIQKLNKHTSEIYSTLMKINRANIFKIMYMYCAFLISDEAAVIRGGQINSK